jgi:MHS family proline/betaine transporter-like MFS transporter
MIFGGFAPAILTWYTQRPGASVFAPAWYVMAAAVIALSAIPFVAGRSERGTVIRTAVTGS